MKVAVIGGSGFIGSNVANYLNDKFHILAVDNLKFGNKDNLNSDVQFFQSDFAELSQTFLDQFDTLIHLACANIIYAQDNKIDTFKVNALDTINLFKKFKGRIIYTSTASIYGQADIVPTTEDSKERVSNAYDQSKLIAEKLLQLRGNYTTLRLSNVYGINQRPDNPYSGVISKFIDAGIKGRPMRSYGQGLDTRDYTYISDVVNAIELAVKTEALNTEINISGNCETSITNLIAEISTTLGIAINMTSHPKRRIDTITRRWLDCTKAKELLKWEPKIDLKHGLKLTIDAKDK